MNHPDIKHARRHGDTTKCLKSTEVVYSGTAETSRQEFYAKMKMYGMEFAPEPPKYKLLFGEVHGHTNLSDGYPDIDTYFTTLRDVSQFDFGILSDHDHGGPCHPELWVGGKDSKWEYIKKKVIEYNEPHKFTTLLAYERDSWPFYGNMIVYYKGYDGEMIRGETDGMLREHELRAMLSRDDILVVPHDSYAVECGTDFTILPMELMPPLLEMYSCGDPAEYMNHPAFVRDTSAAGCFWQDALKRGARMGCIAGSDGHSIPSLGGTIDTRNDYPRKFKGATGVWAEDNTNEAIFDALQKRRCYGFMCGDVSSPLKGRIEIDFRIDGHYMGEEFSRDGKNLTIYYDVKADEPIHYITIVKNCRDYLKLRETPKCIVDYHQELDTDCYYLRVELKDGRFGWSSPIWVNK